MRLIIDTDVGVADSRAIRVAFGHHGVTVEAITTISTAALNVIPDLMPRYALGR